MAPNTARVRRLVVTSLLTALLFVTQVALAALPNIEVTSLLIALYTLSFGWQALVMVYGFVLMEGLLYGFGLWFINYLYIWAVLWALCRLFRHMKSTAGWVILLAAYGLGYGLLCAIPYLFIGGVQTALAYFLNGIPFDLLHCAGNAVMAAVLFKPMRGLFARMMERPE